ncbi:hypothetical protein PORY_000480 [Pneumocystis oryctolagi]|uniref:Uncharacterized protein n=1 Tax=Pneumocystis oryctolagi TaxID=42067 RepID=A0ACB7CHR5_9ASCO|nr:hypothetical protein PORY_000480 [Pneumocystis oryctolagi]
MTKYRFLVPQTFLFFSSSYFRSFRIIGLRRVHLSLVRHFNGCFVFFRKNTGRKCIISDNIMKKSFDEKRLSFQYKVSDCNLEEALQLYTELSKTECLTGYDVSKLIALIHYHLKMTLENRDDSRIKFLLFHLENVLNDIYSCHIPGHPMIWVNMISIYTDLGLYQMGEKVWEYAKSKHIHDLSSFDSRVYGAAIKLYSSMGAPLADCERLFHDAIHLQNMSESLILYEGIIVARIQNNDKKRAFEALKECLSKFKDMVRPRFFDSLIYCAINKGVPKSVVEIVLYFLDLNYLPSPEALSKLFKQLWKCDQDLEIILKVFSKYIQRADRVHIEHINFILITLFKLTDKNSLSDIKNTIDKVNDFLCLIHKEKICLDVSTFNTLISGYTLLEQFDQVEKTLQEMKMLGVSENEITLRTLLKTYGKKGHSLQEVSSVWERIVKLSLKSSKEIIEERNWLMLLRALSFYGKEGADLMASLLEKHKSQIDDSVLKMMGNEIVKFQ